MIGGVLFAALSSGGGSNGNSTSGGAGDNASGNARNSTSGNADASSNAGASGNADTNGNDASANISIASRLMSKSAAIKNSVGDNIVYIGEKKELTYTLTKADFESDDENDYVHIYEVQQGLVGEPLEQKNGDRQTKKIRKTLDNKDIYKISIDVAPKKKEQYFIRIKYCHTTNKVGAAEIDANNSKLQTKEIDIDITVKDREDLERESVSKDGMERLISFIKDRGKEFDEVETDEQKTEKAFYILGVDQSADCGVIETANNEKKNKIINAINIEFFATDLDYETVNIDSLRKDINAI